jgi:methyl-accepting chemotaxis protein
MALFTANGTIVFPNTFDLIVAYVIYLMIFSAAVFVAVFGRNVMPAVRQEQERSEPYAATSQVALEQTAATAKEVTTFTEEISETVDAAKDSFRPVDLAMQQLASETTGSVQAIREIRQLNEQQVNRMQGVPVSVDRALERSSSSRTTAEQSRQTIGLAG